MFSFEHTCQDSKTLVTFTGDLDIEATEILEDEVMPLLSGRPEIEIDFSGVPFVDSSGIGLLITLITHVRENSGCVVITNVSSDVQQIFSLLQLSEILGHDVFIDLK
ncbi:STAS domain-containing protein [Paenibacillus cremeus]|uniref:Anti-sigma factor antagonist n=1 Tax=Paenibacillus cremeus TaxID=2163881 RepID=A0A559K7G8_9BACL|nr:STAS domain-containing protein [Paenibacillus cremeus]TVY08072.1 STAS domain-containing protein [Paenibacillus cremeus]